MLLKCDQSPILLRFPVIALCESFGPQDSSHGPCHHLVPIYHKAQGSELKHAQVFGGSEAPREDGGVVVGGAELGQVGDLAAGNPCRLLQNIPGKSTERPTRGSVCRRENRRMELPQQEDVLVGVLTCEFQVDT